MATPWPDRQPVWTQYRSCFPAPLVATFQRRPGCMGRREVLVGLREGLEDPQRGVREAEAAVVGVAARIAEVVAAAGQRVGALILAVAVDVGPGPEEVAVQYL